MLASNPASSLNQISRPMGIPFRFNLTRSCSSHSGTQGRVEFPAGICEMEAEGDILILRATAADEPSLAQVEEVVARHLERFAFRDQPEISWTRGAT